MGVMINIIRHEKYEKDCMAEPVSHRVFNVKNEHVERLAREVIDFSPPLHSPCEVILCKTKKGREILERHQKQVREYSHKQHLIDNGAADEVIRGMYVFGMQVNVDPFWKQWNREQCQPLK